MVRTTFLAAAMVPLMAGTALAQGSALSVRLRAELLARPSEEPARDAGPLPLVTEHLRAEIDAQHATTTLQQVFGNTADVQLEGTYVLRPSLDARVHGFAYYIGEQRIEGEVIERRAARRVYEAVTTRHRDPAILEQTADGEFTFQVFPIQPGEDKRIETTFSEWLSRRGSRVTYRVPLVSVEADAEVLLRDPRAADVRSPTHRIDVEPLLGGGVRVRTGAPLGRRGELVIEYRVEERPWQANVHVHRDEGHEGYFLLSLAAPEGLSDRVAPKDVTLVLDRSGSMSGEPLAHAQAAAAQVIRHLDAGDRLNVMAFDDDVYPLFESPRAVRGDVRAEALSFVGGLTSGGGTDIARALAHALSAQQEQQGRPQVVLFLTDGQSPPEAALEVASRDRRDVRVFTVGIGNGVNQALLSRLAAVKRGDFTYIDRPSAIEREVGHLYAKIARPLLVDVSVSVEGAVASRMYPRTLPDLFVDDELVVTGRLRGEGPVRFVVRGHLGGQVVEYAGEARLSDRVSRPWVGRRWGIARASHLLEELQLQGETPELRDEVVSLALAYGFATPYTAFLAIPRSEVTAEAAQILDGARADRARAAARHADATAIAGNAVAPAGATLASHGGGDSWGPGEADQESAVDHPLAASAESAGCASCTVGARRPPPGWGIVSGLVLVVLVGWRSRRRVGRR